ncbi:MAG: enoyl-CoA hydratase/isomerase family protein [Chloroflexia bacterium]|nr:enoyl-CoA hydratase/isomerase family protein [Chloroflexia bacterium]
MIDSLRSAELTIEQAGLVRRVTLNRPERRNALSRSLVGSLRQVFAALPDHDEARVVVIAGEGPVFCAGGDIREFAASAEDGNARSDAEGLVDLLATIAVCPLPVVARVHGAAFGGAVGLIAAADIVITADDTKFSLSEARLGMAPAVVGPYVVAAIGARAALAHMLLAAPFDAPEALRIGLVHRVVPAGELDTAVNEAVANLLWCAPGALHRIKRLCRQLVADPAAARDLTVDLLVERLGSDEGQEGLRAFLEKRLPAWEVNGPDVS